MILSCKVQFHFCIRKRVVSTFRSKIEVLRDVQNSNIRKQDKFRRDLSQHKNKCKSQGGTSVRRSNHPLFACCTLCKIKKMVKIRKKTFTKITLTYKKLP